VKLSRALPEEYLYPAERLSEVLFGIVMVLTVTSATSLAVRDDPDGARIMLLAALGTNAAWGIVDGALYIITNVFERGRMKRVALEISDLERREGLAQIEDELEGTVVSVLGPRDRKLIAAQVYAAVHQARPPSARITREDVLGAIWVFALVFVCVLPPVIPFLWGLELVAATLLSHVIAVAMLFVVGFWYGSYIEADRLRFALGMTSLGLLIVITTVLLGG
jgi:VIT1/CCC1 family predicted Fe2+/Mn2+ transporter